MLPASIQAETAKASEQRRERTPVRRGAAERSRQRYRFEYELELVFPQAMGLSLPKDSLLTKPWQYQKVYSQGKRSWGKGLTLIYVDNDQGQDRLGISISGQKLAVRRNRIKRLLKEFYRHNRNLPSKVANHPANACCVDLVIATNQKFQARCLADIQKILGRHAEGSEGCGRTTP